MGGTGILEVYAAASHNSQPEADPDISSSFQDEHWLSFHVVFLLDELVLCLKYLRQQNRDELDDMYESPYLWDLFTIHQVVNFQSQ